LKAEKILLIVLLVVMAGAIAFADVGVPVYFNSHFIVFNGKTYDPALDRSTWSYTVTSSGSPAISHWILGLCLPDHVVTAASPSNWSIVDPDKFTGVSGIKWDQGFDTETTIDFSQPKLEQWFGGTHQSLGTLTVTVKASVDYEITAYYTVTPTPTPAFDGDPLRFEYPSGTWTVLPKWPGSVDLLDYGFNGIANTPSGETFEYPVQIDLLKLGDREGAETFTFTIHVVLSEL